MSKPREPGGRLAPGVKRPYRLGREARGARYPGMV